MPTKYLLPKNLFFVPGFPPQMAAVFMQLLNDRNQAVSLRAAAEEARQFLSTRTFSNLPPDAKQSLSYSYSFPPNQKTAQKSRHTPSNMTAHNPKEKFCHSAASQKMSRGVTVTYPCVKGTARNQMLCVLTPEF